MEQDQHMNQIQLFNFAYDTQRGLTKVIYRGREAAVALEFGRLLGYAKNGSKLVDMITMRWADRFREGIDYELLKGRDLQDFKELSPSGVVAPSTAQLMILYTSGIHLVLLNTTKAIGTQLHHWLADEVFPSLKETGSYHLNPADRKVLPVPALFREEIRTALSKIKSSFVVSQKDHPTPRDFAVEWDETHKAHTAPMFNGVRKTSTQIKAIARQRGVKVLSNTSARKLI